MTGRHFTAGSMQSVTPAELGLEYTSFAWLDVSDVCTVCSGQEEVVLAVISGSVDFVFEDQHGTAVYQDILYLPIGETISLSGRARIARFGAPCIRKTRFVHIPFAQVDADGRHKRYGKAEIGTERDVWNSIDDSFDSSRFLVGFCHGAPGGWTAWPPHAHGDKREEVYVYFGMEDGFALQCVYDDLAQAQAVFIARDGDVISVPGGFHPNVGCPKSGIHYLFCMVSIKSEDRTFMDLTIQPQFGDTLE